MQFLLNLAAMLLLSKKLLRAKYSFTNNFKTNKDKESVMTSSCFSRGDASKDMI